MPWHPERIQSLSFEHPVCVHDVLPWKDTGNAFARLSRPNIERLLSSGG
jgi:hypothetical protein